MEGPKLNVECCFSCLEPFASSRSEINISENSEALKRILDVNLLLDRSDESMNLCIPCYNSFKEAKEEFLQLREIEKRFNSKRTKFAFRVVKSVQDDDYLGTSIVDDFLNARAKIYNRWHRAYKAAVKEDKLEEKEGGGGDVAGVETETANTAKVIVKPVKFNPVPVAPSKTSPIIVKQVVSMQNGQSGHNEVALQKLQSAGNNLDNRQLIYVKRDKITGKVVQLKTNEMKQVTYRIANKVAAGQSPRIVVQPTKNLFQINKDGTVVKHPNPVIQPQARPIVRTPIPTPTRYVPVPLPKPKAGPPVVLARKSLPTATVVTMPIKRIATVISPTEGEEAEQESSGGFQIMPEKKRRESTNQTSAQSPTQLSNRSRRIIRKPVDSSCLYGNEYERAVKNSSKKNQPVKVRAVKRNSDAAVEMMDEDSYRYDMDEHDEGEEATFGQIDYDGNIDEPQEEVSDIEN